MKRIFILCLSLLLLFSFTVTAQAASIGSPAAKQIREKYNGFASIPHNLKVPKDNIPEMSNAEKKLSTKLLQLTNENFLPEGKTKAELINELKHGKRIKELTSKDGKAAGVYVYIQLKNNYNFDILNPYLIKTDNKDNKEKLAAVWADIDKIDDLASLEGVKGVSIVTPPVINTGSVTSEGDSVLQALQARSVAGIDGTGIKIGIISDGVDSCDDAIASGDLPSGLTVLSNSVGGDEGTAMLEIVHDLAPGAQLYFHDHGANWIAFNAAIDALIAEGCDIICDDIQWLEVPFFEDGIIASHVKDLLESKDIIYVSSAGNAADSHYQGNYYNDGYDFHDFSRGYTGDGGNDYIYASIPSGGNIRFVLEWNDPFGGSSNDYDIYLYDPVLEDFIAESENVQDGTQDPLEFIDYTNNESDRDVIILIHAYENPTVRNLELYAYCDNGADLYDDNKVAADSIFGHPSVPGVIACGAVRASAPDNIEYFSSNGPVTMLSETRNKPDICGADGISITGAGGFPNPFYGTSASAPHIAAIAALLEQRFPDKSPAQIKDIITQNADDLGDTGFDYVYGYGRADTLRAALSSLYITFESNGGSSVSGQLIPYNTKVTEPEAPTREGYVFGGWYKDSELTVKWDFDNDTATEDTTLYAKWTVKTYDDIDYIKLQSFLNQTSADIEKTNGQQINPLYDPEDPATWTGIIWSDETPKKVISVGEDWSWSAKSLCGALDISDLYALTRINIEKNSITSLNIDNDTALDSLRCYDNQIQILDTSTATALTYLSCGENQLTSLDLSTNNALINVDCENNILLTLVVNSLSALQYLSCQHNNLVSLDVSMDTALTFLGCTSNQLQSLNVNGATALSTLFCGNNQLTTLDLSTNMSLETFDCQNNMLLALDVSAHPVLNELSCQNNQLNSINTNNTPLLACFDCSDNNLTLLDISSNTELEDIQCSNNKLTSIYATIKSQSINLASGGDGYVELFYNNSLAEFYTTAVSSAGRSFIKWTSGEIVVSTDATYNLTIGSAYDLVANFTVLVSFNSQGGSLVDSQTVPYNTKAVKPADPTRTGYNFGGWYKESGCTNAWDFSSDTVTSNITLYAKWIPLIRHTITATVNSSRYGYVTGAGTYSYGTEITLKAIPKAGYRFKRWLEGTAAVSYSAYYTFSVTRNRTLKAEFASISRPGITSIKSAGYKSIGLSWGSVSGAAGYEVFCSTSSRGTYVKIKDTANTSYTDTGLATGKRYYYKVRAYCIAGATKTYSSYSRYRYIKPIPAASASIKAATKSASKISVSWNAVDGATMYMLYRSSSSRSGYRLIARTASLAYEDTGLSRSRSYYYKVRAYHLEGSAKVYGEYSTYAYAKTWAYDILATWGGYIIRGIQNRPSYGYLEGAGEGGTATIKAIPNPGYRFIRWKEGTATTSTAPVYSFPITTDRTFVAEFTGLGRPYLSSAVSTDYNSIKLVWKAVTGATGYAVYRSTSRRGTYYEVAKVGRTITYTDTGLTFNKYYYYKVKAYYKAGTVYSYGRYSGYRYAKTKLSAPVLSVSSAGATSLLVDWNEVAGAEGYEVYRATSRYGRYLKVCTTAETSYINTNLTTNRYYYYKVRAYRMSGTTRIYSSYSRRKYAKPVP